MNKMRETPSISILMDKYKNVIWSIIFIFGIASTVLNMETKYRIKEIEEKLLKVSDNSEKIINIEKAFIREEEQIKQIKEKLGELGERLKERSNRTR